MPELLRPAMEAHSLIPQLIGIRNVFGSLIEQLLPPGKYTESTLNKAIMDVVSNHPDGVGVTEIQKLIVAGGYKSRSPYLRGIVHSTCIKVGDVWTFISVDADSRMVPNYFIGKRSAYSANCFVEDLAARLDSDRVQVSSDALSAYVEAVERGFGSEANYGQIVKTYSHTDLAEQRRYSPPKIFDDQTHNHFWKSRNKKHFNELR